MATVAAPLKTPASKHTQDRLVTIRLSKELRTHVEAAALQAGVKVSEFVRSAIERFLSPSGK